MSFAKRRDWTRYSLRLPPDLYDKIVAAAGRDSVNTEIVTRLEASFADGPETPRPSLESRLASLEAQFDILVKTLEENGFQWGSEAQAGK